MSDFNSYNSNTEYEKKSVNTRGQRFYSNNVDASCCLEVGYYDSMVRLAFVPKLPESARTQRRVYDYDNQVFTAITRVKVSEICNEYDNKIKPAIMEGKDESATIVVGGINAIVIGSGVDEDGVPHPFIMLAKNLNESRIPEAYYRYDFNIMEYITGYNVKDGSYQSKEISYAEVDLFFDDLKNAKAATSNAYIHADRVVNRYWKDKLDDNIKAIGRGVGVDLSSSRSGFGNGGKGSPFDEPLPFDNNSINDDGISSEDIDRIMEDIL